MPFNSPPVATNLLLTVLVVSGCNASTPAKEFASFETDGSPESAIVQRWLSGEDDEPAATALIPSQAQLLMSDYGVPLTRQNVERLGPDRVAGCTRSTIARFKSATRATWNCPPEIENFRTYVDFRVSYGRILSANYTEALQALTNPTSLARGQAMSYQEENSHREEQGPNRLDEPQIRARLIGKRLSPAKNVDQLTFSFAEDFLIDGTWIGHREKRTAVSTIGSWRIEDDKVCVTVPGKAEMCRSVWLSCNGIAIRDMESPLDTIIIMSANELR